MEDSQAVEDAWVPSHNDVLRLTAERLKAEVGNLSTFAARLKLLRMALGLSVERVAEVCELDDGSWSNWENGTIPRNMGALVTQIATKLRPQLAAPLDSSWLMWGDEIPCFNQQSQLWPVAVKDAS